MSFKSVLALFALVASSPALAQEAAPPTTNWPTSCQSVSRQVEATCLTSTVAFRRDSGQKMVEVRIVTTPGQPDTVEAIGPFGTSVDAPFRLRAGNDEILSLAIRTCEQDGCHAFAELDADARAALTAAESLSIIFTTPGQGDIVVPLPTAGLASAMEAITP